MAEFVLKNNYFEVDCKVKKQISGTVIKELIFMDKMEREFLKAEDVKPWIWLRYIDNIFFIWIKREKKLEGFLKRFKIFYPKPKN